MQAMMINGPCGAGKSTTARLLYEQIPNSVLIQTDSIRKVIPERMFMKDDRPDAVARMWQANIVGRQIAEKAFMAGRTVIVDSIKYQTEWVKPWEALGEELGAEVLDICVIAPKTVVEQRAAERGYKPDGRLTPEKVSRLFDQVVAFYEDRPNALIINNEGLEPQEVIDWIFNRVAEPLTLSL